MRVSAVVAGAAASLVALGLGGCSTAPPPGSATGVIHVVAAENFWGSIVAQLGGSKVRVDDVIDNPTIDPHDYEPTTGDARAVAMADFVVVNGVGYDTWATRLVAANPDPHRTVLTVGQLLGVSDGSNPHFWYNPSYVQRVVERTTADLIALRPADAGYFRARNEAFRTTGTAAYRAAVATIRSRYSGTPVGASESIFAMIAPALGLDLVTPPGFLRAISEGTDPTAADKATIDTQIKGREIAVYVYNAQNATPDVQRQIDEAKARGIPVTTITETMTPADSSWQDWQTTQLVALRHALAEATGR